MGDNEEASGDSRCFFRPPGGVNVAEGVQVADGPGYAGPVVPGFGGNLIVYGHEEGGVNVCDGPYQGVDIVEGGHGGVNVADGGYGGVNVADGEYGGVNVADGGVNVAYSSGSMFRGDKPKGDEEEDDKKEEEEEAE